LRRGKEDFEVVLLCAHTRGAELRELAREFPGARLVLGQEELLGAISGAGADITVNGISGAAGLAPSLAALRAGSHLALANKETVVMAGPLVFAEARKGNLRVLPVDSEHMAIASLLEAHGRETLGEILLTASGGPFRKYTREQLAAVSPREALAHPTWNMGPKITIDSASLANKGLEVIEAVRYFDAAPEQVRVVVHPQSIVHSMIRQRDGTVYAQLSKPDMRLVIQTALYWPQPPRFSLGELSFDALTLDFEKPDPERFPLLSLAYGAARAGALYPAAYNAANEAGVAAFLAEQAAFLDIPRIVEYVLSMDWGGPLGDFETVMEADRKARELASAFIKQRRTE
jgi:1-deoxy-D-xylulose-5-phosphate reductoisomerase